MFVYHLLNEVFVTNDLDEALKVLNDTIGKTPELILNNRFCVDVT